MASATLPLHQEHFYADLRHAESIRKKIVLNYSIIGSVLFIGLIIEAVTWMSIAILVIALFVLVYTRWYGIPVPVFEQAYIHAVTGHIISPYSGLQIDYQSHLKASEIKQSGFITSDPDYFSGRNLIHGYVDANYIRMSEVYMRFNHAGNISINSENQLKALVLVAEHQGADEEKAIPFTIKPDQLQLHVADAEKSTGCKIHASISDGKLYLALIHEIRFAYLNPKITKTVFFMTPIERYERDVNALINLTEKVARG